MHTEEMDAAIAMIQAAVANVQRIEPDPSLDALSRSAQRAINRARLRRYCIARNSTIGCFDALPDEIVGLIMRRLTSSELVRFGLTCRQLLRWCAQSDWAERCSELELLFEKPAHQTHFWLYTAHTRGKCNWWLIHADIPGILNNANYVGEHKHFLAHGYGCVKGSDISYKGQWKYGVPHGEGHKMAKKCEEKGMFKWGALHGQGTRRMLGKTGWSTREGMFYHGFFMCGLATFSNETVRISADPVPAKTHEVTQVNGVVLRGASLRGIGNNATLSGEIILQELDGKMQLICTDNNDKVRAIRFIMPDGSIYKGPLGMNLQPHGHGRCKFSDGTVVVGNWSGYDLPKKYTRWNATGIVETNEEKPKPMIAYI
jgi:hypothetical protein